FHLINQFSEFRHADGALFARLEEAGQDFLALELLPAAVLFDDHIGDFVDSLICSKSTETLQAFPTPANDVAFFALTAVDYAIFLKRTKWTVQEVSLRLDGRSGRNDSRTGPEARSGRAMRDISDNSSITAGKGRPKHLPGPVWGIPGEGGRKCVA